MFGGLIKIQKFDSHQYLQPSDEVESGMQPDVTVEEEYNWEERKKHELIAYELIEHDLNTKNYIQLKKFTSIKSVIDFISLLLWYVQTFMIRVDSTNKENNSFELSIFNQDQNLLKQNDTISAQF